VVEPGNVAALADRLAEALADPARLERMGQAGRAWYDEQRGLEEKTLLTMYERVVGTAKAKGKRTSR
jgi:glycosyltransferase involved in cell wall biosynthesis